MRISPLLLIGAGLAAAGCESVAPPALETNTSATVLRAKAREIQRLDVRSPAAITDRVIAEQRDFGRADTSLSHAVAKKLAECKLDCEPAFASLLASDRSDERWIAYRAMLDMSSKDRAKLDQLAAWAPRNAMTDEELAIRGRLFPDAK